MSTIVLWHGAHRWEGPPQLQPAGKLKSEEGSGLYLTTSEQTARKYAKGGGTILRFEVDSNLRLLGDVLLDTTDAIQFVSSIPRLRNRTKILADIQRSASRLRDPNKLPAYVVENLIANHDALKGEVGPLLAQWFVSRGVDANLIRRSDEDWLVLYNLDKIQSYRRATPDEVKDLPRIGSPRSNPQQRRPNPLAFVRVTEDGHRFESGVPVTFPFFRNTERAPHFGARFQQDIEPAGRYMLLAYLGGNKLPGWEFGSITFRKPLVLAFNTNPDGGYDATSWKAQLARAYGRTGRALSRELLREGFDGIVTVQLDSRGRPMHTKEIVDLSVLRSQQLKK